MSKPVILALECRSYATDGRVAATVELTPAAASHLLALINFYKMAPAAAIRMVFADATPARWFSDQVVDRGVADPADAATLEFIADPRDIRIVPAHPGAGNLNTHTPRVIVTSVGAAHYVLWQVYSLYSGRKVETADVPEWLLGRIARGEAVADDHLTSKNPESLGSSAQS